MRHAVRILVHDFTWIHLSLGLIGNIAFFAGSIFFLPNFESFKLIGIWLFIVGSFLMMIGAIGQLLVNVWEKEEAKEGVQ